MNVLPPSHASFLFTLPTDYIFDKEPLTNRFISVPKDMGDLNCAAFVAGIINGVLDAAEFVS